MTAIEGQSGDLRRAAPPGVSLEIMGIQDDAAQMFSGALGRRHIGRTLRHGMDPSVTLAEHPEVEVSSNWMPPNGWR